MKLHTIGTGSSGNCYLLVDGDEILILDAGVAPTKRISKALYSLRPARPVGCLITHEHADHSCAVSDLTRMGIRCYGSPGTAEVIRHGINVIHPLRIDKDKVTRDVRRIGRNFRVLAFPVRHDAKEPCGFLITCTRTGERMVYITDTWCVDYSFPQINYWLIECNYCEELITEDTPPILARRLGESHMSLNQLCKVLSDNDLHECRKIILCHVSRDRGNPGIMARRVHETTHKTVEIAVPGMTHRLSLEPF